jgi:hypothetical protein
MMTRHVGRSSSAKTAVTVDHQNCILFFVGVFFDEKKSQEPASLLLHYCFASRSFPLFFASPTIIHLIHQNHSSQSTVLLLLFHSLLVVITTIISLFIGSISHSFVQRKDKQNKE